jgi:hypothetical protein
MECDGALESSQGELQLWFRPHSNPRLEPGVVSVQSPGSCECSKSWESNPGQFRDSSLGVPGKCAIRMLLPRWATENTIWGKVVASLESGPYWVLCVKVPVACPNTQGCSQMLTNPLVVGFGCRFKLDNLIPLPSLIPRLLACPLYPLLVLEVRSGP